MKRSLLVALSAAALAAASALAAAGQAQSPQREAQGEDAHELLRVPSSMAEEHEALHAALEEAVESGGRTGEAARELEAALAPHFEEENEYALPPLGLLPRLVRDGASEGMRPAIEMARHVEQNLDRFLEEHRRITEALDDLEQAAREEGKAEQLRFVEELRLHARQEEELFYPMAIVIGRYLEQELE